MYGRIFVISTNGAIMRHIIIKIFHHPEVKMIPDNQNTLIKKIKSASHAELISLADDLRKRITETVSESGGHLASNLGMVEATIALHRVFDSPSDKLIFDVGHQCYAHKLITGRYEDFGTLRKFGGISGFTNRFESEHDVLSEGHCGTSVSAAIGIATANRLAGNDSYTVAIVGDGALTNGMVYEALNNCADKELNLVIVINDNEMSISENVGGLHRYLSRLRTSKGYFSLKRDTERFLLRIPLIGKGLAKFFKKIKDFFKRCFVKSNLFEDMGLIYLGPVDGHDIEKLSVVLNEAKSKHKPCIVHIHTKKGYGYAPAEESPDRYHSVPPFDVSLGVEERQNPSFSSEMGRIICEKAKDDARICAITAAMCEGTGLKAFSELYPDRFFDVGIAEEHAVTFAEGLAVSGLRPVLLLYSTFAQRVFDQLFHDISIQQLPLVLALDRCGLVPGDGITHQGIFDYSLFSSLPKTVIYAPSDYEELSEAFDESTKNGGLSVICYPKGGEFRESDCGVPFIKENALCHTDGAERAEIVIITCGRMTEQAVRAAETVKSKYNAGVIKLKRILPLPKERIIALTAGAEIIYILEEGIKAGGFGEKISDMLAEEGVRKKVVVRAIEDYVGHGDLESITKLCGLSAEQVSEEILLAAESCQIQHHA